MKKTITVRRRLWVKSPYGPIAGVCQGLGHSFNVDPWVLRILFIVGGLFFPKTILIYLLLALMLPRMDRLTEYERKKMLGVCLHISHATGLELPLVRMAAVVSALASFGLSLLVYLALYFLLPCIDKRKIIHL